MSETKKQITVVGAGLVGSLLSIFLAKRGHQVRLFEKRPDMRKKDIGGGRSINLALSDRGWKALDQVGLSEKIREIALPMRGRMIHDEEGNLTFQPYGKKGQAIYSVSRALLNKALMDGAEAAGVEIQFEHLCLEVDTEKATGHFEKGDGSIHEEKADFLFGADGAFSAVRNAISKRDRFTYSQTYLTHGYKELEIKPGPGNGFLLEPEYLHIWPRHDFMLIALPNPDRTFTCTLFFPFEGSPSFEELERTKDVKGFFKKTFPDAFALMPDLEEMYRINPTSSLVTIRSFPWVFDRKVCLLGDASHAIVPFYGQGMNSGFEDCTVLMNFLDNNADWEQALENFQKERKMDADAISELALNNFIEMRDKVADKRFLLQKKVEGVIQELFPDRWTPLYSRVTFSHEPYSQALALGKKQDAIMQRILDIPGIETKYKESGFKEFIESYIPG